MEVERPRRRILLTLIYALMMALLLAVLALMGVRGRGHEPSMTFLVVTLLFMGFSAFLTYLKKRKHDRLFKNWHPPS